MPLDTHNNGLFKHGIGSTPNGRIGKILIQLQNVFKENISFPKCLLAWENKIYESHDICRPS